MEHNYRRYEGETDEQLIFRVCQDKERIGTWSDVSYILNDLLGANSTESRYRKAYQYANKMLVANEDKLLNEQALLDDIKEQRRELEKAKIQFRDERNEWNKQNRLAARTERDLDYLGELLGNIGKVNFESKEPIGITGNNDLLICISDVHMGEETCNYFGAYNSDIAKQRLDKYLQEILKIQERHGSENATVAMLGDMISGIIHITVQVGNRENLIDQIKIISELLTSFIYELSTHFKKVNICSVSGNHSRVSKKDDALKDERLDDLVFFIMQKSLAHLDNVDFREYDSLDTSIACTEICGREYILVHGDYDKPTESGVMRLCTMVGTFPEAIVMGHRHSPAYSEINGIKVIQSGCLSGSGGDYCIQQRLTGSPSQMVCVCDKKGVQTVYPINLS